MMGLVTLIRSSILYLILHEMLNPKFIISKYIVKIKAKLIERHVKVNIDNLKKLIDKDIDQESTIEEQGKPDFKNKQKSKIKNKKQKRQDDIDFLEQIIAMNKKEAEEEMTDEHKKLLLSNIKHLKRVHLDHLRKDNKTMEYIISPKDADEIIINDMQWLEAEEDKRFILEHIESSGGRGLMVGGEIEGHYFKVIPNHLSDGYKMIEWNQLNPALKYCGQFSSDVYCLPMINQTALWFTRDLKTKKMVEAPIIISTEYFEIEIIEKSRLREINRVKVRYIGCFIKPNTDVYKSGSLIIYRNRGFIPILGCNTLDHGIYMVSTALSKHNVKVRFE